ncbi:MAG: prepilin-type N-terminal cleavage/methylation domain-containing protein [Candidatus Scalindua sp.]|nr:prepilin-type N-terminal cleavage/methylation domain-containing protein [Candidatus Scalindua sp.]
MNKEIPPEKKYHLKDSAFTLVELIVAVSLASIIILITVTLFNQASTVFSESDACNEVYQNARSVFDIMKRDLSGSTLNANYGLFKSSDNIDPNDYLAISAKGGSDILTLLSSTPNHEGKPIALITYFLTTGNILNKAEITLESTLNTDMSGFDPDTATGFELGFNVDTLQFKYLDTDGSWKNSWDSTTKRYLPAAVEVTITISDMRNRYSRIFTRIHSIP